MNEREDEMIRSIAKPNRIKDGIGVAVFAVTALLYAFEAGRRGTAEECAACESSAATEVTAPADASPAESLISITPEGDSLAMELDAILS
jgi:hypothetical protein